MKPKRDLDSILEKLALHHGAPAVPPAADPFRLILHEQVAYLVSDDRRAAAFARLEAEVGLTPEAIRDADPARLEAIAAAGGSIGADLRADRMRESAARVLDEWDGDLTAALCLPVADAVRALRKFPMIGKPGAEKILLLTRSRPLLALESNALRVLVRLGYGENNGRYERTYASARAATAPDERADFDWLISLAALLRRHGQRVCRNKAPACERCPLTAICAWHASQI